ncbi:hypothetical protein [Sinorhizobium meliloti]|uniref:hypothetical protein n=1 Tax=Rhizobium meliloti TaxID=382 RepID=UPI0013E3075A|nr:hypothetical protein [Sinorhizobium meliloti]
MTGTATPETTSATEIEVEEKKDHLDDALNTARAAAEKSIEPWCCSLRAQSTPFGLTGN